MEIERKFLVTAPPKGYEARPFRMIEQAYLCTEPVVWVRREVGSLYLTYKSRGLMAREEYNLPLDERAYPLCSINPFTSASGYPRKIPSSCGNSALPC